MFAILAGILLILALLILMLPVWMRDASPIPMGLEADENQQLIDLEIEKQTLLNSLAELDLDLSQGRLNPQDHQRLKAVDENRLGPILDRLDSLHQAGSSSASRKRRSVQPTGAGMKWAGSAVLSILVLGSAAGIYSFIDGRIGLEAQQRVAALGSAPSPQGMPNPLEMVARLEKRIETNPDDLQGQIMLGRSYMTLQRLEDAKRAWSKVIELDYGNYEAHHFLGLTLLQTSRPEDTAQLEEALSHFDTALVKVPREPAVLWYKGVALVQLKRYSAADESWTTSFTNLAPGSEDADFVKEALQRLRAGDPPVF